MSARPARNLAASIRQRLLNYAKQNGVGFQEILVRYGTERLLYRLSQSAHRDGFVLKGAVLFAAWAGAPHRPSRDADLLGLRTTSADELTRVFRELALAAHPEDGLVFDDRSLRTAELAEGEDYPGVRVTMRATLDGALIPLQIDVAFGQAVEPPPQVVELPTLLELPRPRLNAYPPEAVVAEKFEALVKLGTLNSRLKDFYDLWFLLTRMPPPSERLATALAATFTRRGTPLPAQTPTALTSAFTDDQGRQRRWAALLDRVAVAPEERPSLSDAVAAINKVLMPIVVTLRGRSRA